MPGIMDLIWPGAFVVQSIHVVARLGIADLLGPEPRTADELAEAAQVHGPSLHRILRALATLGVFAEDSEGRFRHTDLSEKLRADHPESVRAWALMLGAHFVWRPLGDLYESVRTGTGGFRRLYGEPFFAWTTTHPEDGAVFQAAMTSGSAQRLPAVLAAYDFSRFECVVDVGGGHGALLAGILTASPRTRGVLYDLPSVVTGADALRAPDIAGRCEVVGGDFFDAVPAGGDAYLLSRIIHDWDDEAALKILGHCRRAIRADGRLLLFESVSKPPNEPDPNKFLDVWFIGGGGRERTEAEYRALLRRAGFALARAVPTGAPSAILESHPV
ncbi:MAG TPA: methyltransferase [Methylomirabilota bacterium]|nr:methyltransferase [Methylomirabilota bacterium]